MTAIHTHPWTSAWAHLAHQSASKLKHQPLLWLFILLGLISFGVFVYYFLAEPHPEAPWHSFFQ
ncbi:MAG: hypothetical protein WHS88_02820 [Anaerohalosphaeraceae bacterium]